MMNEKYTQYIYYSFEKQITQEMIDNLEEGQVFVAMFKCPRRTKHFNKNQKIWVKYTTGQYACAVRAKHRNKGRYLNLWFKWEGKEQKPPYFKIIAVDEEFAKRIQGH